MAWDDDKTAQEIRALSQRWIWSRHVNMRNSSLIFFLNLSLLCHSLMCITCITFVYFLPFWLIILTVAMVIMVIIINITEITLSRLIIMVHSDATTKIIIFEYARLSIIIIIRLEFHIITDKNNNDRSENNKKKKKHQRNILYGIQYFVTQTWDFFSMCLSFLSLFILIINTQIQLTVNNTCLLP